MTWTLDDKHYIHMSFPPSQLAVGSPFKHIVILLSMSSPNPSLLSLPQELRDHIYSFLFLPATWTTEHPFPSCLPSGPRFSAYATLCLVNRALYNDAKAYFVKHIATKSTFYFTSVASLRRFQDLAQRNPILQQSKFSLRCADGYVYSKYINPDMPHDLHQDRADVEAIEALIRIQPGFHWWMDELPGFYRSHPATLTNYGYFPPTGPNAWKPSKHGFAVFEQTGGEVCDSETCSPRAPGNGREAEVTEVHYPVLHQAKSSPATDPHTETAESASIIPRGPLNLSCYIWQQYDNDVGRSSASRASIMVLEGKPQDVWIPPDPVAAVLRLRAQRMT